MELRVQNNVSLVSALGSLLFWPIMSYEVSYCSTLNYMEYLAKYYALDALASEDKRQDLDRILSNLLWRRSV